MNGQMRNSARRAAREDLFPLLSFLHGHLPDSSAVYTNILSLIATPKETVNVFYTRSEDKYSTVVGLKQESSFNPKHPNQKITWIINQWTTNAADLMSMYESLHFINWKIDGVKVFSKRWGPDLDVVRFLTSTNRQLHLVNVNRYILDPVKALELVIQLPDDVYVTNLQRCHAEKVHEHWPPKVQTSVEDVADDIDQLPSAGVFLKADDLLVCWVVSSFADGFSKLHTLEQYRRHGYATLAVQYLARQLARSGCVPFAYITVDNDASKKLFQCIGFQLQCEAQIAKLFAD